jgi:hypothetical protein
MRRISILIIAGILSLLAGTTAGAALSSNVDRAAAQRISKFGQCVAKSRTKDVEKMLSTPYGSDLELHALLNAARTDMDCDLSGARQLNIPRNVLTGAIFEGYFHRVLEGRAGELAPLETGWRVLPTPADAEEGVRRGILLNNFGACLAYRNPQPVVGLLRTEPATEAESVALVSLSQFYPKCSLQRSGPAYTNEEIRTAVAAGLVNRLLSRSVLSSTASRDDRHA